MNIDERIHDLANDAGIYPLANEFARFAFSFLRGSEQILYSEE